MATRRWRTLPPAPIAARYGATAVWTGSEMLVVGGLSDALTMSGSLLLLAALPLLGLAALAPRLRRGAVAGVAD